MNRPLAMYCRDVASLLGCTTLFLGCALRAAPLPNPAPVALPVDTAAVALAALELFDTPNGPFVEVLATLRCRSPCPHAGAEAAIASYAARIGAHIITEPGPSPVCRWSAYPDSDRPRGLRVAVLPPEVQDGMVSIWVAASCHAERGGVAEPFQQATRYQAEFLDGRWQITKVLDGFVT